MKRQSDDTITTRVYSYGTVPQRIQPAIGEDAALKQLKLANRLWNVLVAIDHARVARYRLIMRDEEQERIELLSTEIDDLRGFIKGVRQAARKRGKEPAPPRLAEAKAERAALIKSRAENRAALHDAKRAELTALTERTKHRVKRARQASASMGLFWGTYNDIVQRMDIARKHGGEMHFRRFTGEGTLTAQIMGGALASRCIGAKEHTFFQVDPARPNKWRMARIRIGSDAERNPVWIEAPIVYHRQIPDTAMIKSVSMSRRMDNGKPRWQLNVTVNVPKPAPKLGDRAIAVDIGWRKMPGGVRVGYWQDTDGLHGEILVTDSDISQIDMVASLRSKCDLNRDEFLPALAAWLAGQALPEEWRTATSYIHQWRSTDRLATMVRWWSDNRLPGDEEIFTNAVAWRKQYLHLSNWWRNLQTQMTLRLREQYRVFAAKTAARYSKLIIEEFDLREVVERPKPEEEAAGHLVASGATRQKVSPSVFRGALLNACRREGLEILKIDAAMTTQRCNRCSSEIKWDASESVMHKCPACGSVWDQDFNATTNLLNQAMDLIPA